MIHLPLDVATSTNMEHSFDSLMVKMNHIHYFLHVYAEKGQVAFVRCTIKCLQNHLFHQIALRLPHSNVEFSFIQSAFEQKVIDMLTSATEKYLERAIVNYLAMV